MMGDYHHSLQSDYEASASSKPIINFELIFSREIASPVFTKQNITQKTNGVGENESINLFLVDRKTQRRVTSGPLASSKVKIVLLRGDCGTAPLEFKDNIVVNWKNKKNLLLGDTYVDLENGCGTVGKMRIKHDGIPLKNVRFRLGAMVVGCPYGYEVKEAITNAFDVKDARNAPKHSGALKLEDDVWCLKNIAKNGKIHIRLLKNRIFTVKNFLDLHSSDRGALQKIYRIKGKKWKETINHAKTCLTENAYSAYVQVGSTTSQQSNIMISSFDHDGSMNFDDNCYKPQPYDENEVFSDMIWDDDFSIQDVQLSIPEFKPCQEYQEDGVNGATVLVHNGGEWKCVKAKKRWMKLRTFWFFTVSLLKKLGHLLVQP